MRPPPWAAATETVGERPTATTRAAERSTVRCRNMVLTRWSGTVRWRIPSASWHT